MYYFPPTSSLPFPLKNNIIILFSFNSNSTFQNQFEITDRDVKIPEICMWYVKDFGKDKREMFEFFATEITNPSTRSV